MVCAVVLVAKSHVLMYVLCANTATEPEIPRLKTTCSTLVSFHLLLLGNYHKRSPMVSRLACQTSARLVHKVRGHLPWH
jgi:hypothetical protein